MIYNLSEELVGHKGCVRCICVLKDNRIVTGGLDNQIIIWKCTDRFWKQELNLTHHNKYILALEPSNSKLNYESHDIEFYSGGLDKIIYRLSANNGSIVSEFKGHTSAVCNLKELSELNILVSGSWDGSARIWDISSSTCKHILSGHQHAVAVSITSQPNNVAHFLLTGSQNKSLILWKIPEVKQLKTVSNSHDDIIRSIATSNKISGVDSSIAITVSNDCAIKIWQIKLESGYENLILKNTKRHHSSFIFDVKFSNCHFERFFTASDDCSVAIWKLLDTFDITLLQNISLSSTVWNLAEMNNIDSLLSVSEDGICRIWTTNTPDLGSKKFSISKKLNHMENLDQTDYMELQTKKDSADMFVNIYNINQLNLISAKKNGTIQAFRDGNDFKAYEWANDTWNFLGLITGINDKTRKIKYLGDKYFNRGLYDMLLTVEIEINCNLNNVPFNFGDSILESAEKFCLREGIDRKYRKSICNSIINSILILNNVTFISQLFEPCFEFKLFKSLNIDGLISSLKKEQTIYSNPLYSNTCTNITNFNLGIENLYDFFFRLKSEVNQVNSVASIRIKPVEMEIIYRQLSNFIGNNSWSIPIIDLWRILALHPQSSDIHKKSDQGWWLLVSIVKLIDLISLDTQNSPLVSEINEFRGPLFLICIRFLCNMFHNSTNREVMLSKIQEVISAVDRSIVRLKEINFQLSTKENTNKNVIIACLSLMFNYIVALNNKNSDCTSSRNSVIRLLCKLIPLKSCGNFTACIDEILHYKLLILTNNYYYLNSTNKNVDIYIPEDKYINILSDQLSKRNNNSAKILYYELVASIDILRSIINS
ncbi:hypothetical protein OJ253_1341 [Cryptosporidium canis]|uniref:WD domain-containing protein n=1 Tax=Cryptosporidium canis TaxID=195482 RepID=A0A9D5HY16_9CRYT|nr:hypothetical protein OJ253_1341 [Cryptosporidium canis]